jgi:hypothetical protein
MDEAGVGGVGVGLGLPVCAFHVLRSTVRSRTARGDEH